MQQHLFQYQGLTLTHRHPNLPALTPDLLKQKDGQIVTTELTGEVEMESLKTYFSTLTGQGMVFWYAFSIHFQTIMLFLFQMILSQGILHHAHMDKVNFSYDKY